MTNAEKKARDLIAKRSTKQLIEDFEATDKIKDENIYTVRGWLMDELEKRDAKAYTEWIESLEESPRRFYKTA